MIKKIEVTHNTKEDAEKILDIEREKIKNNNVIFREIECYGNFEIGYKLVQEYETND